MKEIQDHHPFHFLSLDINPFLTQRIKRKLVPRWLDKVQLLIESMGGSECCVWFETEWLYCDH